MVFPFTFANLIVLHREALGKTYFFFLRHMFFNLCFSHFFDTYLKAYPY